MRIVFGPDGKPRWVVRRSRVRTFVVLAIAWLGILAIGVWVRTR